jgi:CheY-like chemotaxis protein
VDDDPVNAFTVTKILERLGHRTRVVGTGSPAVEALSAQDFDVVLLDLHMPEMGGLNATRRVREAERSRGRRVRVLGMTTVGEKGETERCRAAGMDGLLAKPLTLETLAAALHTEPAEGSSAAGGGEKPATSGGDPALDRERLAAQLGGDAEAVSEVLRSFVEDGPRTLTELREALAAGDASGVERAAHRLKGSLRWIAAAAAAACAEQLEGQARSGDLNAAGGSLDALSREVERVLEEARKGVASQARGVSAFGTPGPENDPEGSPGRGTS